MDDDLTDSGSEDLQLVSLRDATIDALEAVQALFESAFPPDELMTFDELQVAVSEAGTCGAVVQRSGKVLGAYVTEDFLGGRVVLLAYLAVDPDSRGEGVGTLLVRRLTAENRVREGPAPLVVAEIEDPRFHRPGAHGDPVARLRFYDRLGTRLLPLPYVQPALRPTAARVDHMLLVTLDAASATVDGALVAEFLEEYFVGCEGPAVVDDPLVSELIGRAHGDGGRLPLLDLHRLDAARPDP